MPEESLSKLLGTTNLYMVDLVYTRENIELVPQGLKLCIHFAYFIIFDVNSKLS